MDSLQILLGALAALPDWVLWSVPAAGVLYTLATALFGGRRAYPYVSLCLIVLAAGLGAGRGAACDLVYTGLTALAMACGRGVLAAVRGREKGTDPVFTLEGECAPSDPAYIPCGQCGLDIGQAQEYLTRLRRAPLTAGDRVEVEVLSRTIGGANRSALTEEELVRINDSLAAMFKIAARYKV